MIRKLLVGAMLALATVALFPVLAFAQDADTAIATGLGALLGPYAVPVAAVILAAKAICAFTPTPGPGSPWATVYSVIEKAALIFGRMKQAILLPVALGGALALSACSTADLQNAQTALALAPQAVAAACKDAMASAQLAGATVKGGAAATVSNISAYVVAGCASAEAITTLARDSSSIAWLAQNKAALDGLTAAAPAPAAGAAPAS